MILRGKRSEKIDIGDVIVFQSTLRPDPIIHRVVEINNDDGKYYFTTKGDHNADSYPFEMDIDEEKIIGNALIRIPFLGYIKIGFVKLLQLLHIV